MNPKDFFKIVVQMRSAQKEYLRFHTQKTLIQKKRIEKEVDEEINLVPTLLQEHNNSKLKF